MDPDGANLIPLVHDTLYNICAGDSLSYQWFVTPLDGLEQSDLILINDTTPFPSLKVDTAGAVNVVLEIENSFGCSQTTSNASVHRSAIACARADLRSGVRVRPHHGRSAEFLIGSV